MKFWWVTLVLACACVRTQTVACEDGRVCPESTRCVGDRCVPVTCGDGSIQGVEVCDGEHLGGADCRVLGYYAANGLACNEVCELDDSACEGGRCGDNVINGPEQCDLATVAACGDFDYDVGRVTCAAACIHDTGACERIGWSIMTSGTTRDLFGVWTASVDFAIAVGANGTILHWNGLVWTPRTSPVTVDLLAVSGSAPDNVIAVGQDGAIVRWDGSTWSVMTSGTTNDLRAVAVVSPDRAFAAGPTTVLQLGATGWSAIPNTPIGDWYAAWADASSLVVVGAEANAKRYTGTWSSIEGPAPAGDDISYGVWGRSGTDLWIVGRSGRHVRFANGMNTISLIGDETLRAVFGGDRFVYVVGANGTIMRFVNDFAFDQSDTRITDELMAVLGETTSHVFAVGRNGRILRMTGVDHRSDTPMNLPTTTLHAAWGTGPNVLYVAGSGGGVWQINQQGTFSTLTVNASDPPVRGLWGANTSRLVLVDEEANIVERIGTFSPVRAGGAGEALYAVWGTGSSAENVFAVGSVDDTRGLVVARKNGAAFAVLPLPPNTPPLYGVTGTSPTDVYASGEGGVILHYDGTTWTELRAPVPGERLNAMWTNGEVFVAAGTSIVMRQGSDRWLDMPSDRELHAVWGATSADIWVAGDAGTVQHFDGVAWAPLALRVSRTVRAIAGTNTTSTTALGPSNDVMFVGDGGFARRLIRFPDAAEICSDRWDNDFDGHAGCADPDCEGHPSCINGGRCRDSIGATCGSISGTTRGGPARIDLYACGDRALLGTEAYYRFVAPASGDVRIQIADADPDLAVSVLGARSGACDPSACLAAGTDVTFTATAGEEYFFVVDSPAAQAGAHVLDITCP